MAKSNKKLNTKQYAKWVLSIVVLSTVAYALFSLYNLGYRKGYLAGTENQVICQASQANEALRALCK